KVVLYDRPNASDQVTGATLAFSDGTSVTVPSLANAGTATTVSFAARTVTRLTFTVTSVSSATKNVGLSELQAWTPATAAPVVAQNVAGVASVTASSQNTAAGQGAAKAVDGVAAGAPANPTAEWVTNGGGRGATLTLTWATPVTLDRVVLYDRPNLSDRITGGTLTFSSGSQVSVPSLSNSGAATTVSFSTRTVTRMTFTVTSVSL
ncbi:DUF7402 domain-containing protein, partial [Klenkia terrae]